MLSILVNIVATSFLMFFGIAQGSPDLPWVAAGQEAKLRDFPFLVFLTISANNLNYSCSGSIIHQDWILTAGHCTLRSDRIKVYAGITHKAKKESTVQERNAKNYYIYPGFLNPWSFLGINLAYDYSLIHLGKSLDINNDTVKLLELENSYWKGDLGRTCTAVGYGGTAEDPDNTKLYFMETKVFRGFGACPCVTKMAKLHNQICFVTREERKSLCPGDSGGPLICNGRQVGVTSYVYSSTKCDLFSTKRFSDFGCGIEGTVNVYTYVTPILNWIRKHVGDTIPPSPANCQFPCGEFHEEFI